MKTLAVLGAALLLAGVVFCLPQKVDLRSLLRQAANPRIVERQVACIVDQGPCDPEGDYLRLYVPLLLKGEKCFRCSDQENRSLALLASTIQRKYPRCWHVLQQDLVRQHGASRPPAKGCAH